MTDLLLSPVFHALLFLGVIVFSVMTVRRGRLLWAVLSGGCAIGFCLLRLAAGASLEQLLIALLLPGGILLSAQARQEGGTRDEF